MVTPKQDREGHSLLALLVVDLRYDAEPDEDAPMRHVVAWRRAVALLGRDDAGLADLVRSMVRSRSVWLDGDGERTRREVAGRVS